MMERHSKNHSNANENQHPGIQTRYSRIGRNMCFGGAVLLLFVGVLAVILTSCHPRRRRSIMESESFPPSLPGPHDLEVRLFDDLDHVNVSTNSLCEWESGSNSQWEDRTYRKKRRVEVRDGTLTVDGESVGAKTLSIKPSDRVFTVKGHNYRGKLSISLDEKERLVLTEKLPLEDYIRSVVPSEMPARWPMEALKAQAVTARTFALHRMENKDGRRWMSRMDMAYKGIEGEAVRSDQAVRRTRGRILQWDDRPLPAFFHSTCGGQTVSAESVFGAYDIPPLAGVKCTWCESSPHYRWESTVTSTELSDALASRGIDRVDKLVIDDRDTFDRVTELLINGEKLVPAADFRLDVGSRTIKSTWFDVESSRSGYNFSGRGWGHGVGLCQYGARGMADDDVSWQDILHHYFPGAQLSTLQSDRN